MYHLRKKKYLLFEHYLIGETERERERERAKSNNINGRELKAVKIALMK